MCQIVYCCAFMFGVEPLKNVFQLAQCAPGIPGAHWDEGCSTLGLYVKENNCKMGSKYIFANKVQTKKMNQPACRINNKQYRQINIWV